MTTDLESQQALAIAADTLNKLVKEGWSATSAKKFVETGNISVLRHTGMVSVQMFNIKGKVGTVTEDDVVKAIQEAKKRGRL